MANEKIPYLCGGVLFSLLKQAVQPSVSSREHREGESDRHSDSVMMKDLIIALSSDANTQEGTSVNDRAFKTLVSKYINCLGNARRNLPFAKKPFALSYQWMVKNEYSKTIEKMQKFIQLHLDPTYYKWLVKAILNVIEKDVDIADTDQFFIDGNSTPKTKEEIKSINSFCLPTVLVGVMHYILLKRGENNVGGAATLNKWGPQEKYIERTIGINEDLCIDREIEVYFEYPYSTADVAVHEVETAEELPENKKSSSHRDEQLYEQFKGDAHDTLFFIIENDPINGTIDFSSACELADLCKIWESLVYKFRDREMRDNIIEILDLINRYGYYLSDEFMRVDDERTFLIFRNQSNGDGDSLRDILQPQITELREKLDLHFRKLYDIT